MQLLLISCLANLVLTKKKSKNVCDFFICADSSEVKCKKSKKIPHINFCSSSDSRSSCSRRSSSSRCKESRSRRRDSRGSVRPLEKKDAVEVIESILACQAFDVKFLVGSKANTIKTLANTTLTGINTEINKVVLSTETKLIAQLSAIISDDAVLDDVVTLISDANIAFAASVTTATASATLKADSQIKALAKQKDEIIIKEVKNEENGLCSVITSDFDEIITHVKKEYPIIEEKELNAIIAAFATEDEATAITSIVKAANLEMLASIEIIITTGKNTLNAGITAQFRELELSLDLLFCETNHLVVDIVKQVASGKKVTVPRRTVCNPITNNTAIRDAVDDFIVQVL